MSTTVGPVGELTPGGVDALLSESTAVAGWAQGDTWSWQRTTAAFELRGMLPPVADPRHREQMLIGGAALLNIRILIRVLGLHPAIQILPDAAAPDLIAIVAPEGLRGITAEDRLLAAGIVLESSAGTAGPRAGIDQATRPLPEGLIRQLRRAAKIEHGWLALIAREELPLPIGLPVVESTGGSGSVAAVIGTVLDSPGARLQAGQAMQRVLLTATVNGVSARSVSAALTEPGSRVALRELIGGGIWPQAILWLGD